MIYSLELANIIIIVPPFSDVNLILKCLYIQTKKKTSFFVIMFKSDIFFSDDMGDNSLLRNLYQPTVSHLISAFLQHSADEKKV